MALMNSYEQQQTNNGEQKGYVGSISGRAFIRRDRIVANERIQRDYFSTNSIFNNKIFRKQFRMTKPLFEKF